MSSTHDTPTPAERQELAAGYRAEVSEMIRTAVPSAVTIYLVAMALPFSHEAIFHWERWHLVVGHAIGDLVFGLLTIAAVRRIRHPRAAVWLGVAFIAASAAVSGAYNAAFAGRAERFVLRELCELIGAALFIPWGAAPQLVALASVALTLWIASPMMTAGDATSYLGLVLAMGGVLSAGVAAYLDHHRRLIYERGARDREAAAVCTALLHAGRTLAPLDDATRIVDETTRLVVEAVGCDWSAVFQWDGSAGRHALAGAAGLTPPEHARLMAEPPPPDAAAASPEEAAQAALAAAWGVRALLLVALPGADAHAPLLACGWRTATHPLPRRVHRLVQGFAEAGALALDGARIVTDLRRANRLKTEFVSTMSHEMRTPLNVILGCLEMGGDPELPEDERAASLGRAARAAAQLLTLIEDTLDLGRLDAGADVLQLAPVELPVLWAQLRAQCATLPRPADVQLTWCAAVAPGIVFVDARKLGVIVRNLVQNALKFTPAGEVCVDVERADDTLVVRVTDTGIGIPPEQHGSVFELFRQGDGSDVRRYGGPGLGLHVVRRFVDEFGGTIDLQSEPGRGTTFTVRLPVGRQPRARAAAA